MTGVCPSCHQAGEVGVQCTGRICARRKYCFIPEEALRGVRIPDELIGLRLDNYLLVELLGSGGFGRVYRAIRLPLQMQVAIKILNEGATRKEDGERLRTFTQEAKALALLSHPNIVRLLDFGSHEGTPYLVTEFVAGKRTLKSEIRQRAAANHPFDVSEVQTILEQTLGGLEAAHAQDIVHRDVKPDNIMLQAVPGHPHFVRLHDFGLAKFVDERSHTESLLGTPLYMAPEQMEGRHIGPWTDLYALGVIAYELMTGYRPFPNDTSAVLRAKRDPSYDVLRSLAGLSIPSTVRAFFKRALALRPEDRFRTAPETRAVLGAAFEAIRLASDPALSSVDVRRLIGDQASPRPPPPPPPLPPNPERDGRVPITNGVRSPLVSDPPPRTGPGLRPASSPDSPVLSPAPGSLARAERIAPTVAVTPGDIMNARLPKRALSQFDQPAVPASASTAPEQSAAVLPSQGPALGALVPADPQDSTDGLPPTAKDGASTWKMVVGGVVAVGVGVALALGLGASKPRPPAATTTLPASAYDPADTVQPSPPEASSAQADVPPAPPPQPSAPATPPPPGFVRIEAGAFSMGSPSGESGRDSAEVRHRVSITRPFWIQASEVTQRDWSVRIGTNPSVFEGCGDACPVENVTWYDAVAYANRLSFEEGLPACYHMAGCTGRAPGVTHCKDVTFRGPDCEGYRLPTEAEWEYAARADTTTATPAGDMVIKGAHHAPVLSRIAWYGGNSRAEFKGAFDCGRWPAKEIAATRCGPHPVRMRGANAWGLHDMLGNVSEWVHDWYGPYPEASAHPRGDVDPAGPEHGNHKVARGGSWMDEARHVRSGARVHRPPGERDGFLGFRLARNAR